MKRVKKKLLLIDDEENMLHMLSAYMEKRGYAVATALDGAEGVKLAYSFAPDLILCDLKMPHMDGLTFLTSVKELLVDVPVIMMSAYATVDTAVEAMKQGAYDFVTKPFKIDEIYYVLQKAEEYISIKKENIQLKNRVKQLQGDETFSSIVGKSKGMLRIIDQAKKVAGYDTSVLITGESGTGKELIARGIHNHSKRSAGPLVSVNCGSVPANLLESEFFGYVKGAFTGADKNHAGLFEAAEGGTLFLDEIGELSLELQVKMLRVLQEHEIRPVGAQMVKKIDVRVLTATAKDLEQEVEQGTFRRDLFFRINVMELKIPPLRARIEDIPFLCIHFLHRLNKKMDLEIGTVSAEAMTLLMSHNWPGNVRELENSLERAMIFAENNCIAAGNLSQSIESCKHGRRIDDLLGTGSLKKAQKILEERLIGRTLEATKGNKSKASRILEISYPSLLAKIKEYGLAQTN